jgi:D-alanyl-D-alanine carboxypeptidase/D-alanyl-D-alanine-endopeptidase (penicillin-binding protein 4)
VIVTGSIAVDAAPHVERQSVSDAASYAGSVLAWALAGQGIAVEDGARSGGVDPGSPILVSFEGATLAEILRPLLVWSSNPVAEALGRAIGRAVGAPPGFAGAASATRERLAQRGVDLRGVRLVDASGLSPENRLTPRALVGALRAALASFERGSALVAALPLAGREGTLADRLDAVSGRVRAKTGRIERVIALSGYARTDLDEVLAFSILVNAVKGPQEEARAAVDEFTRRLAVGGTR